MNPLMSVRLALPLSGRPNEPILSFKRGDSVVIVTRTNLFSAASHADSIASGEAEDAVFVASTDGSTGIYLRVNSLMKLPNSGRYMLPPDSSGPKGILPLSPHAVKLSLFALLSAILPTCLLASSLYAFFRHDACGMDSVFPSEAVNPLVLKLTCWLCLACVVAYEHLWLWTTGPSRWLYRAGDLDLNVRVLGWRDDYPSISVRKFQGTDSSQSIRKAAHTEGQTSIPLSGITVRIESSNSRAGVELKEVTSPNHSSGIVPPKSAVAVKSVSSDGEAALLGVAPGMILLDYPSKASVVERIKSGPYPVILRFVQDSDNIFARSKGVEEKLAHSKRINDRNDSKLLPPLQGLSAPPAQKIPPHRFIAAEKGDIESARQRYSATLQWRSEMGMDHIITDPHPNFTVIKKNYPHYYHLRGLKNEPCYYEKPPDINLKALRAAGVTMDDLLRHFALTCEFMWTLIEPSETGKSIYVIDLRGMGMRDFAGEVVDFVKKTSAFTAAHYPERSGSIFVINVPSWFSIIWKTVSPWIDPVTANKITILGYGEEAITKALQAKISIENIPPEYGGRSMPLGKSPEEAMFREKMERNNILAAGGGHHDNEE